MMTDETATVGATNQPGTVSSNVSYTDPATKVPTLSGGQVEKSLEYWKGLGLPADDFLRAAAADGHKIEEKIDPRSAEEISYDKVFSGGAADAYKMVWVGRIPEGIDQGKLSAFDAKIRGALSAMNFPPNIGPGVMEDAFDDGRSYNNMDETSQKLWDRQQRIVLGRVVGEDKIDRAMENAKLMLSFIEPELREDLFKRGLFRSARTVAQLHLQAERWEARADMVGRRKTG